MADYRPPSDLGSTPSPLTPWAAEHSSHAEKVTYEIRAYREFNLWCACRCLPTNAATAPSLISGNPSRPFSPSMNPILKSLPSAPRRRPASSSTSGGRQTPSGGAA
jgi:hypothetical protein